MTDSQFNTFLFSLPFILAISFLLKRAWDSWLTHDEEIEYTEQKNYFEEVQKPILNSFTSPEVTQKNELKKSEVIVEKHFIKTEHHHHHYYSDGIKSKSANEKNVTPKQKLLEGS